MMVFAAWECKLNIVVHRKVVRFGIRAAILANDQQPPPHEGYFHQARVFRIFLTLMGWLR